MNISISRTLFTFLMLFLAQNSFAALSLDRSRLILNEGEKAVSVTVLNNNTVSPYLTQSWIEDASGKKITQPLMALPPIQRIEPSTKGTVRLQIVNDDLNLPSDRESLFYLNVREIPPKSKAKNSVQFALQTRIKVFYRPKGLISEKNIALPIGAEKIKIVKNNSQVTLINPTPYHLNVVALRSSKNSSVAEGFVPVVVKPKDKNNLLEGQNFQGDNPVISLVNDFGSSVQLAFRCNDRVCDVADNK